MATYLCYDIRGIQSFIFRIPKLRYIIGGSALIDTFDRQSVPKLGSRDGVRHLFSGGGKGTFLCDSESAAETLRDTLIDQAHEIGLDIRFGIDDSYQKASIGADELYPFMPESMEGKPCPGSGLYPVGTGHQEHPIVRKRLFSRGEPMFRYFEERLRPGESCLPGIAKERLTFFHNVDAEDPDEREEGGLAARALGGRNRWAVVCMDGNDMGMQHRHMTRERQTSPEEMTEWLGKMSTALDTCTTEAVKAGIQKVISDWAATADFDKDRHEGPVILPLRPLVVGGDDIVVLCHVAHAMSFVKEVMRVFKAVSFEQQEKAGMVLWPATGGRVSISAGVLYCPVSLPLHTAISYAESLLASAKQRGRGADVSRADAPSVECVDWDQVTESIITTPAVKRQRELIFTDADKGDRIVELTARPCTLEELEKIERLSEKCEKIPPTIRHTVLPGLRRGFHDRLAFIAALAKHQPRLAAYLAERDYPVGKGESRWIHDRAENRQRTDIVDALLLLEEKKRMEGVTIDG
jgi:hypothetical protein